MVAIDKLDNTVSMPAQREVGPPKPQPTAALRGEGSQAHKLEKSLLWPLRDKSQRNERSQSLRGSGSGEADGDADEEDVWHYLHKNNVLMAFFNSGGCGDPDRLEVFSNNLYLTEYHVFCSAEAQQNIIDMIVNTGKYRAMRAPNTKLVCFCHNKYFKNMSLLDHGGTDRSKYAIFRIEWDGIVGGASETVLAAFHLNNVEANKRPNQDYGNMENNMNRCFRDFARSIIKWKARIVMGDANMGCYAVEKMFAYHRLTASLLAFHAEYVQPRDLVGKSNHCPRQLKWDSCGIWSIGPIANIKMQGPAKHCLAAAVWPQRADGGAHIRDSCLTPTSE